jgi:hypothetical protein
VFESRVLSRIFGPKGDEATEEWRKLHNKKLHNLYVLVPQISLGRSNEREWVRRGMWHAWERRQNF